MLDLSDKNGKGGASATLAYLEFLNSMDTPAATLPLLLGSSRKILMSAFFLDDDAGAPAFLPPAFAGEAVLSAVVVAEEGVAFCAMSGAAIFGLVVAGAVVVH